MYVYVYELRDQVTIDMCKKLREHINQNYPTAFQVGKALASLNDVETRLVRPPKKELRVLDDK